MSVESNSNWFSNTTFIKQIFSSALTSTVKPRFKTTSKLRPLHYFKVPFHWFLLYLYSVVRPPHYGGRNSGVLLYAPAMKLTHCENCKSGDECEYFICFFIQQHVEPFRFHRLKWDVAKLCVHLFHYQNCVNMAIC